MSPATLTVFGKHPAWSDHMPALGTAEGALAEFQQAFYHRGIGECLAQERWRPVGQAGEAVPWNHWIWSIGPAGCVLACCTASSDAKGRKQYPLVAAMGGPDAGVFANAEACLARLRHVSAAVAEAPDETAVHLAFSSLDVPPPPVCPPALDRKAFLRECAGGESAALPRVMHALSIHGAGYQNARVGITSAADPLLWLSLTRHLLEEESREMTLTARDGAPMADLFLHPADSRALGCLFTDSAARPPSQEISYRLAEGWETVCRENAAGWSENEILLAGAPEEKQAAEGAWRRLTRLVNGVFPRRARN